MNMIFVQNLFSLANLDIIWTWLMSKCGCGRADCSWLTLEEKEGMKRPAAAISKDEPKEKDQESNLCNCILGGRFCEYWHMMRATILCCQVLCVLVAGEWESIFSVGPCVWKLRQLCCLFGWWGSSWKPPYPSWLICSSVCSLSVSVPEIYKTCVMYVYTYTHICLSLTVSPIALSISLCHSLSASFSLHFMCLVTDMHECPPTMSALLHQHQVRSPRRKNKAPLMVPKPESSKNASPHSHRRSSWHTRRLHLTSSLCMLHVALRVQGLMRWDAWAREQQTPRHPQEEGWTWWGRQVRDVSSKPIAESHRGHLDKLSFGPSFTPLAIMIAMSTEGWAPHRASACSMWCACVHYLLPSHGVLAFRKCVVSVCASWMRQRPYQTNRSARHPSSITRSAGSMGSSRSQMAATQCIRRCFAKWHCQDCMSLFVSWMHVW